MILPNLNSDTPDFPEFLDRSHFGHWLSGFTDGEGCFDIRFQKKGWRVRFSIHLRYDDIPVLKLIKSYLGCGKIYYRTHQLKNPKRPNEKMRAEFAVQKNADLAKIVVPHFEQFPLVAKKSSDFQIWREAVLLCWEVQQRNGHVRGYQGMKAKWTDNDRKVMEVLSCKLRAARNPLDLTYYLGVALGKVGQSHE